jgi:4-amino-4-deoxy-L-arabinose transferase-like glycosyltransferase
MVKSHLPSERLLVGVILAAYLALAVGFSLGPIFEGPDEIEHYRYIRTIAEKGTLPDPFGQPRGEYHQAPLYYLLAAPFALGINDRDFAQIDGRLNPYHGSQINVPSNDNRNVYLHTRAEAFPYDHSPTARAVHLIRVFSVLLGLGVVMTSYAVFRILWPDRPDRRLLALGAVAFWPQFLYQSSVISNDVLLYLLATICLWLLLRQLRDGPSRRGMFWLGMVLGAILLTKVSAVFIALPVGLALLLNRHAWRLVPITLAALLSVAGWWYGRNAIVYNDATGTQAVLATWPSEAIRPGRLAVDVGLQRIHYAYESVWARFGHGAVAVGESIYLFFDGLVIVTLSGIAAGALRGMWSGVRRAGNEKEVYRKGRKEEQKEKKTSFLSVFCTLCDEKTQLKQRIVVGLFAVIWVGALLYWASVMWSGNQGRYLLPGIAAWGALVAWGLDQWTPRPVRMPAALGGIAVLAVIAAICLFGYFLPAYQVSPVPAQIERPLNIQYGEAAQLIGMAPAQPGVQPGAVIRLTLYWRALRPAEIGLQAYLHSVDSNVVRRDSLPGTGNLLSTDWRPGETWAERYVVSIPADAPVQTVSSLIAGLYDPQSGQVLPATDGQGHELTPIIGRIAINGPPQRFKPAYRFGNVIGLAEPTLTQHADQVEVCLRWLSLAKTSTDYHVFVHVLGADGTPITQADFQPKNGVYPTGAWSPGEAIDDCVTLDVPGLPETGWQVAIGLYNLDDGLRLPVRDSKGRALPDDLIQISYDTRKAS